MTRAADTLASGHSVIIDAVFAMSKERTAVETLAHRAAVPFIGLWLEGSAATLRARVAARTGDASDATPDVIGRQLRFDIGSVTWTRVDADGGQDQVIAAARALIGQD